MSDIIIRVHEGEVGPAGKSAYEIAKQNGYTGTEEEWLESLKGEQGPQGPEGPQGPQGPEGPQGAPGQGAEVVDNLESEDADKALSANQGRILGAAIADITQQLSGVIGSGVIARASNVVTATGGESSIEIGISGFDSDVYHLDAYCNGVLLALTSEYTIDDEDGEINLVDWTATADDVFTFIAYKKDPIMKTTVNLTVEGWSGNTQTVTVNGVTATNLVIVAPSPAYQTDYVEFGIICTTQGTNSLTFSCTETPDGAIEVGVAII